MMRRLLFFIFLLLPHISFPGLNRYPVRPADFFIMAAGFFVIYKSLTFPISRYLMNATLMVFIFSVASVGWGYGYLAYHDVNTMSVGGERVFYLSEAVRKIVLLFISLFGFHLIVNYRRVDNATLLRFWFYGLIFASLIHIGIYVIDLPLLARRSGVFDEGNFGGSYYLLSFFLMWIGYRDGLNFGRVGMISSLTGLLLTQSSSALIIIIALTVIHILFGPSLSLGRGRSGIGSFLLPVVFGVVIFIIFGDALIDKLVGGDISNPNSFSRYDRLSSILSGLSMFESSPIFGVGIQGYSFALPNHANEFLDMFFDYNSQRIANNIYAQILAEQGIVGFTVMFYFIYKIIRPSFCSVADNELVLLGFASVLLSWFAFPSYTNTFHWLGFALLFRVTLSNSLRLKESV
jgi:O-antigen ligase